MSMIAKFRRVTPEKLEELKRDPSLISDFLFESDIESIDIDKAWHGIHFMLVGDPWSDTPPLGSTIMGGAEFGEDLGYGPARYLTADQVREVASALSTVKRDDLASRFNQQSLKENEIYPFPMVDELPEETWSYLIHHFDKLVRYYDEAARHGNAMLLYVI